MRAASSMSRGSPAERVACVRRAVVEGRVGADLGANHVLRHLHHHRAEASGLQRAEGAAHDVRRFAGRFSSSTDLVTEA
jgi:hypothetical protein